MILVDGAVVTVEGVAIGGSDLICVDCDDDCVQPISARQNSTMILIIVTRNFRLIYVITNLKVCILYCRRIKPQDWGTDY